MTPHEREAKLRDLALRMRAEARFQCSMWANELDALLIDAGRETAASVGPKLSDLQRICGLNTMQAMRVQQYIARWTAAPATGDDLSVEFKRGYDAGIASALAESKPAPASQGADITELMRELRSVLMEEPMPNGQYVHLLECSGDRFSPPGTPGKTCICLREKRRALAALVSRTPAHKEPETRIELPIDFETQRRQLAELGLDQEFAPNIDIVQAMGEALLKARRAVGQDTIESVANRLGAQSSILTFTIGLTVRKVLMNRIRLLTVKMVEGWDMDRFDQFDEAVTELRALLHDS